MYTELEIVNHVLGVTGNATTPTLATQHPAVLDARAAVASANKEFQGNGWWFNRERNLKLLPDIDGRVHVPAETLSFQVTQCVLARRSPVEKQRFVKRGQFIYDNVQHTNILDCAVWVDITTLLPIEDMPAEAGAYLKHYAAENAFLADDGDLQVYRALTLKTQDAWALLKGAEMKVTALNALESPAAAELLFSPGFRTANPMLPGGY